MPRSYATFAQDAAGRNAPPKARPPARGPPRAVYAKGNPVNPPGLQAPARLPPSRAGRLTQDYALNTRYDTRANRQRARTLFDFLFESPPEAFTKAALQDYARELGLQPPQRLTKAELLNTLREIITAWQD